MSGDLEPENSARARSDSNGPIGARLVAAREQRMLTSETVAGQLRLDVSVINALENDDAGKLPAPIFVQGYLRSYARLLELPEDELVNDYTSQSNVLPPLTVNSVTPSRPFFRLPSMRLIRNIVLVMLAVILLWMAYPYLNKLMETESKPLNEQSPGHLEIPPEEK